MYEYIALGDSITVGVGATSRYYAYPWLIKSLLDQQICAPIQLKVLARSGWTSSVLKTALFSQDPLFIQRATVISIWIGGDDLAKSGFLLLLGGDPNILSAALLRYKQNITSMIAGIRQISRAKIILCTQYNPFPNSAIAVNGIHSLNEITKKTAASFSITVAPIHYAFAGHEAHLIHGYTNGLIEEAYNRSSFPIHPNNAGQRVAQEIILSRF
ncbi:MAG: hypothetical protein JWM44_2689 [Bacilli bacterium]|nr:hypothetical protein [Bacilli bacterium]